MSGPGFWWSARGLWIRSRALLALSVLIAAMPVLAGVAGLDWAALAMLWLAFVLGGALTRSLPEAGPGRGLAPILRAAALQAVMVMVLYGLGMVIATLTGPVALPSAFLPALVALLAALLTRAIWNPLPPGAEAVLDEALHRLDREAGGRPGAEADPGSDRDGPPPR